MKRFNLLIVLCVLFLSIGCSNSRNEIVGVVIIKYSGDKITDVWKIKDENRRYTHIRRYKFIDASNNIIYVSAENCKRILCYTQYTYDAYHEYHAEFNNVSYQELYAQPQGK